MAQTDRFYIGQIDGKGLQSDLKPYAIPDDAFSELNNAYVFRGRVRKRFGGQLMRGTTPAIVGLEQIQSRLKINLGPTVAGTLAGTVPGSTFAIGQAFSVGSNFFTVYQAVGAMYTTGPGTGTYDTTTGAFNIVGAPAANVYFYPATPVMGLITLENSNTNSEDIVAFDTQFAYKFSTNGWERIGTSPTTSTWHGTDYDFFWGTSVRNYDAAANFNYLLFVSNYSFIGDGSGTTFNDPIRYWDGVAADFVNFTPGISSVTPANVIVTARIIVQFKNRLLLLNVVENYAGGVGANTVYQNRCRFSQEVNFITPATPATNPAFWNNIKGYGGAIDAPTAEAIITAQFLKDRLIVYFESSTWEIVFTGNQDNPFVWQKINTELGAESTFSQVPFDKFVLGVGNVGIHACNGSNVDRIDEKIPDEVFEIHNDNNGIERVAGIRDYYTEMVYWTFPSENRDSDFPFNNRVLVYNYKNGSWSFNDDSITAFGYFQSNINNTTTGITWGELNTTWDACDFPWRSAVLQAKFKNVIAGNQEGFTFIVNPDVSSNCPSLQITQLTYTSEFFAGITAINHNLKVGDFVKIENAQGVTSLNGLIRQVSAILPDSFLLDTPGDIITGTYTGGGTLTRVTPIDFKTKQYNFYADQGRNAYLSRLDCFVDRTTNGQCTVDFYVSASDQSMITQATLTGSMVGTSVLETSPYLFVENVGTTDGIGDATGTVPASYRAIGNTFLIGDQLFTVVVANGFLNTTGTGVGVFDINTGNYTFTGADQFAAIFVRTLADPFEAQQDRLWHPVFFSAEGETVQFRFYLNDDQSKIPSIAESDFELHAFVAYAAPTSSRI